MKTCNISLDSGVGLELRNDEIHIWCASLDQSDLHYQTLSRTLSTDERIRAERFYFEKDRRHFIICRGILRKILGNYLGVAPVKLMFYYGRYGKPEIVDTSDNGKIRFNLAHSEGLAIYAFTIGAEIGTDIEYIREIPEMNQIAKYIFSGTEIEAFCTMPESKKIEALFDCWTRKEAIVKATGEGLSLPLNKFEVTFTPDETNRFIKIEGNPNETSRWSVYDIETVPGYAAAIAVRGLNSWQLRYHQWSGEDL